MHLNTLIIASIAWREYITCNISNSPKYIHDRADEKSSEERNVSQGVGDNCRHVFIKTEVIWKVEAHSTGQVVQLKNWNKSDVDNCLLPVYMNAMFDSHISKWRKTLWGNTIHNKKQPEKKNAVCQNLGTKINTGKFSQIKEHCNEHKLLL